MKRSSTSDSDPPIPRSSTSVIKKDKKKKKRSRRTSIRLRKRMMLAKIKSQTADRSYLNPVCVTRTVEWPATKKIGEEKSKLLFMLAIGLNPKPGKIQNLPRIVMTKLNPAEESNARAKTREHMFELFQKRKFEAAELRLRTEQFLKTAPSRPPPPKDKVEIVNLVSDYEDEGDQNDESKAATTTQAQATSPSVRSTRQRVLVNGSSSSQQPQVITSQKGQRPHTLMPLLSKKEDKILFQKWKPKSFSKLVDGKNAKECGLPPLNGVLKQLMAPPLKKSAPASSPLTVRNQASSPIWSTSGRIAGGVDKTGNSNDVPNDGASSTLPPENLIIIDLD